MAEYIFTTEDLSLTTTWKRISQRLPTVETIGYDIVSDSISRTFTLNDIVLAEGETIKRVMLKGTLNRVGSTDYAEQITVNGLSFSTGARKLNAADFIPGMTWKAQFYFCASGNVGKAGFDTPREFSCTLHISNITLIITTGTGSAFDGKIESLPEGSKIIIDEPEGVTGTYTLVHHNYNDGLCLIWRDNCLAQKTALNYSYDYYNSGATDTYLTDTFYANMPSSTKNCIQQANYPTLSNRLYGGTVSDLYRHICIPSVRELKETVNAPEWNGVPIDYLETVANGEYYWTRSIATSSSGLGYRINVNGSSYTYDRGYTSGIRPCFCLLESQLVSPNDEGTAYLLSQKVAAPANLYLNGSAQDLTDLQRDTTVILSWDAVNDSLVQGYEVLVKNSLDEEYVSQGSVAADSEGNIPTQLPISMGGKGYTTKYFAVKAITTSDTDFLDSEPSSIYRSAATKKTNFHYFNGTIWLLGTPKYYDGSNWKEVKTTYYNN